MSIQQREKKFLVRGSSYDDIEIIESDGNYLLGSNGKKYIDFVMGWCVGNVGWSNQTIRNAIKNFKGPDYVSPSFIYKPWGELAELLVKLAPGKLSKCFRATGGTEAVDLALQAANAYTKKHKFISIKGAYHGNSIGTKSIGSAEYKKFQPGLLLQTFKIAPPLNDKAANEIEALLKQKNIAAVIMEPIICNLAVEIPEQKFMSRVQQLCKKHKTLFILDEVATGFYRTGKFFAAEHFNLQPDILCLGKAITGGYGAMGATLMTNEVAKAFEKSGYWSTYGWHPLSVVAAAANIKFLILNKKKLEKNINTMSKYFYQRLKAMNFKYPAEIRIKGLAIGVVFKKSNYASQIVKKARKKGLLLSLHSGTEFTLFPALTIDKETAKRGLDILSSVL